jgi:hypothetical protein
VPRVRRRPDDKQDGSAWSFALALAGVALGAVPADVAPDPVGPVGLAAPGVAPPGVPVAATPVAAGTAGLVPEVACPLGGLPEEVHPAIRPTTPTAMMSAAGVLLAASFITSMTLPESTRLNTTPRLSTLLANLQAILEMTRYPKSAVGRVPRSAPGRGAARSAGQVRPAGARAP